MDWKTMLANGQFSWNMYYSWKVVRKPFACMVIIHSCGQVPKSIKSRGEICPILLRRKGPFHVDWGTTMQANGFFTIFQE